MILSKLLSALTRKNKNEIITLSKWRTFLAFSGIILWLTLLFNLEKIPSELSNYVAGYILGFVIMFAYQIFRRKIFQDILNHSESIPEKILGISMVTIIVIVALIGVAEKFHFWGFDAVSLSFGIPSIIGGLVVTHGLVHIADYLDSSRSWRM